MYFAVIGDIMSNFAGLKSILDRLDEEGICRVFQTGNICAAGLDPSPCVALLRARQVICVQGQLDKGCVKGARQRYRTTGDGSIRVPHPVLESAATEFLCNLPRKRMLVEERLRILVCHGAVNSGAKILDRHTPRAILQRQREQEPADIIISGGSAEPYACLVDNVLFVMPGRMVSDEGGLRYTRVDTEVLPPAAQTVTL